MLQHSINVCFFYFYYFFVGKWWFIINGFLPTHRRNHHHHRSVLWVCYAYNGCEAERNERERKKCNVRWDDSWTIMFMSAFIYVDISNSHLILKKNPAFIFMFTTRVSFTCFNSKHNHPPQSCEKELVKHFN